MSDKKNDFETDLEEKRAEIANKKSRNHTNNNIYERFISRVQNDDEDGGNNSETDDVKPLEDPKKSSTLDVESNDNYVAPADTATGLADSKETHMSSGTGMLTQEPPIPLTVKKSTPSQDKITSSKKPLVIGMIFGSLLIAIIVVTLIFTGVLSPSIKTDIADNSATNLNDNVVTTVTTGKPIVSAQPASSDDNSLATEANTMVEPPVTVQDDLANDTQSIANDGVDEISPIEPGANHLEADAAITYEDFRQESQNTLYRETDD